MNAVKLSTQIGQEFH